MAGQHVVRLPGGWPASVIRLNILHCVVVMLASPDRPVHEGLDGARGTPTRTAQHVDWDRLASGYDWQLPLERAALAAAVDLADAREDDVLLDVGTGTGGLLHALAHRAQRPRKAIGIDVSATMLDEVGPLPEGWSAETADARCLRFEDGTFSVVTAAYLLHVVDDAGRDRIIREVRRVLAPGGRFVVVTPARPRTRLARMLYAPLAAAGDSEGGPRSAFRPLDPRAELETAGFTVADARHVRRGYPSICVAATR